MPHSSISALKPWTILVLSRVPEKLVPVLTQFEDALIFCRDREVTPELIDERGVDFIVCCGFGRIIPPAVFERVRGVNVHWSLLPFCRGPFPHLWMLLEGIPAATSVHLLTPEVDAGDLVAQTLVDLDVEALTLGELLDGLIDASVELFEQAWPAIRHGEHPRMAQPPGGSFHTRRDKARLDELLLERGMDWPVPEFRARAREILGYPDPGQPSR